MKLKNILFLLIVGTHFLGFGQNNRKKQVLDTVQIDTVKRLLEMYNNRVLPVIFTQGSLGASGDLSPLSHLSLPLLGLGEVTIDGVKHNTASIMERYKWSPIKLQSKEGLALINGTQFMSAYGMYCLQKAEHLIEMAHLVAALSFDAFNCTTEPLSPQIHSIRAHEGQVLSAKKMRDYLVGSSIANDPNKQITECLI